MTGFVTAHLIHYSQADRSHKTTSPVVSRRPRRIFQMLLARHIFALPMVTNATNPTHCVPLLETSLRPNLNWHLCDHSQHHPS